MDQKVLTWSNSQLNSRCSFHVPCLFFVLYMYSSQNSLQVSKTFVLIYMVYNYMLRMAFLIEFAGQVSLCFPLEVIKNEVKAINQ